MKRMMLWLLALMLLCACQPTPDQEFIVNRGDELYEKKLSEAIQVERIVEATVLVGDEAHPQPSAPSDGAPSDASLEADDQDASASYSVDSHWTETVSLQSFDIVIDVDVEAPSPAYCPVYQVGHRSFAPGDGQIAELVSVLCGRIVGKRVGGMTVEECKDALLAYTKGLYDPNTDRWVPYDAEAYSEATEEIMETMRTAPYEDAYTDVPEGAAVLDSLPCAWALRSETGVSWELTAEENRLTLSRYRRGVIQPERWIMQGYAVPAERPGTTLQNVSCTEAEARSIASRFLDSVSFGRFAVSELEKARITDLYTYETVTEGWYVQCARTGGDCDAFQYARYSGSSTGWLCYDTAVYSPSLPPESVALFVDADGVEFFAWSNPIETKSQVVNSIELLPFSEVKRILTQVIKDGVVWIDTGDTPPTGYFDCTVSRVILSYCYVPIKNEPEAYYFTPTWFVLFGFDLFLNDGQLPFVIAINAVDGARIDLDAIS